MTEYLFLSKKIKNKFDELFATKYFYQNQILVLMTSDFDLPPAYL